MIEIIRKERFNRIKYRFLSKIIIIKIFCSMVNYNCHNLRIIKIIILRKYNICVVANIYIYT